MLLSAFVASVWLSGGPEPLGTCHRSHWKRWKGKDCPWENGANRTIHYVSICGLILWYLIRQLLGETLHITSPCYYGDDADLIAAHMTPQSNLAKMISELAKWHHSEFRSHVLLRLSALGGICRESPEWCVLRWELVLWWAKSPSWLDKTGASATAGTVLVVPLF